MPLTDTAPQRFFISTELAHDGDRMHADLEDGTSLLLVLRHDEQNGWYLTFDQRAVPDFVMIAAESLALIVLRKDESYRYPYTRLQKQQVTELGLKIGCTARIIGFEKCDGGARIDRGARIWIRIGDDPQFGIPDRFHRILHILAPLAFLAGRPVNQVYPGAEKWLS